jgi:uncharacterized membrane protein YdbT with pleckstrin-like domain
VPDDDRAVMDRLAALEAEVKADADAQRARKEAALAKVREERAKQHAERDELRQRQADIVARKPARREADVDHGDFGGALELAGKANRVRSELARKPGKGEKSWIKSAIASTALGPIGWLYAGSMREAIPAATLWLAVMALVSKFIPMVLLMPVLMVALPLSGLAGVLYAVQYNRHGGRQRLFGDSKKQLPAGSAKDRR